MILITVISKLSSGTWILEEFKKTSKIRTFDQDCSSLLDWFLLHGGDIKPSEEHSLSESKELHSTILWLSKTPSMISLIMVTKDTWKKETIGKEPSTD